MKLTESLCVKLIRKKDLNVKNKQFEMNNEI